MDETYGLRLAAAYLVPGVVGHFQAGTLTLVAPEEDSWAVAGPGDGTVRVHGPRDVWGEHVHGLRVRDGSPMAFHVDIPDDGAPQHVTPRNGHHCPRMGTARTLRHAMTARLPDPSPRKEDL
ncbi:hypothetical protein ACFXPV_23505 [Streptomyces sp. NPDC059118]|uniref:hypothetical protein n=1 Tax=unclassified Streptomyces TaxID=2593676 RepID=UPI0036C6E349